MPTPQRNICKKEVGKRNIRKVVASSQHNICKVLKKNVTSVKEERYNVTIAKKNNVTFVSVRNI